MRHAPTHPCPQYLPAPNIAAFPSYEILIYIHFYQNGVGDWLLVDEHLIDLSGRKCNKVGVNFEGFRNQNGKCYQLQES